MRVPGIQFSLFSSPSSPSLLFAIDTVLAGFRLLDSSRPSEDTVRDNFRRLSCTGPAPAPAPGDWLARMFCLEDRDRWLRDRCRPRLRPGEVPSVEVELDKALRASVSTVDSQMRGSRERPNRRSGTRAVTGSMALWLLRRLPLATGRRVRTSRFLDGEGSLSARMTASPSDDMEIRKALRPLGGDGVISSSLRTRASPSKEREIRSEGGDLELELDLASCRSDVDRLRLQVSGVIVLAWCWCWCWCFSRSSISVPICELDRLSSVVAVCELDTGSSTAIDASCGNASHGRSSSGSGASSLLGSNATRGARSSCGCSGLDFRRSFWRRFWNHICFHQLASPRITMSVWLARYLHFLLAQRDSTDNGCTGGLVWFGVLLVCGLENGVVLRTISLASVSHLHDSLRQRRCT